MPPCSFLFHFFLQHTKKPFSSCMQNLILRSMRNRNCVRYIHVLIISSHLLYTYSFWVALRVRALRVSVSCLCLNTSFVALTHCHSIKGHACTSDVQIGISSPGLSRKKIQISISLFSSLVSQFKN